MKKFFANSILNTLFFFILLISIYIYMELSPLAFACLVAIMLTFSDYIKKRCQESLNEGKSD